MVNLLTYFLILDLLKKLTDVSILFIVQYICYYSLIEVTLYLDTKILQYEFTQIQIYTNCVKPQAHTSPIYCHSPFVIASLYAIVWTALYCLYCFILVIVSYTYCSCLEIV
jgi:hypothetical protein